MNRVLTETTIVKNGIVLTVNRDFEVIDDGAVVIQDDRIVAVGDTDQIARSHHGDTVIDARGKLVMPGLINIHTHSAALRGAGEGYAVQDYLLKRIRPYRMALRPEDVYVESLLNYCEAARTGTTCMLDMQQFMDKTAEAVAKVGLRSVLSPYCSDKHAHLSKLDENEKLFLEKHNSAEGRVKVWFGVDGIWNSTIEYFEKARELANKYKTGINAHAHTSMGEIEGCKKEYGRRPLELFYNHDILGSDVVLAHALHLGERDIRIIKTAGSSIAHCPSAGMRSGGVCPVPRLLAVGINVGLGTDSISSNATVDMFEQMKFGLLLHKMNMADPMAIVPRDIIKLATIGSAKALGMGNELGSIEVGKKADIIIVNLRKIRMTPRLSGAYNNLETLVTSSVKGEDVDHVFVDGKRVVESGKLVNVREEEVMNMVVKQTGEMVELQKPFQ